MTSWSILRFQATWTLPPMTKAHFHDLCIILKMLLCSFIVYETMFAIGESRATSTASACKSSPRKIFH